MSFASINLLINLNLYYASKCLHILLIIFSDDFIHASYVRGGPLLNTFILTQAPLPSTVNDFWQMVWQERSKYIIMLCKAVDIKRLGLLDGMLPNTCVYYWPR